MTPQEAARSAMIATQKKSWRIPPTLFVRAQMPRMKRWAIGIGAGYHKENRNSGDVFTACWCCGGDGLRNGPVMLTPEGPKRIEVRDGEK